MASSSIAMAPRFVHATLGSNAEHAVEIDLVRFYQTMGKQVQFQIYLWHRLRFFIALKNDGDKRLMVLLEDAQKSGHFFILDLRGEQGYLHRRNLRGQVAALIIQRFERAAPLIPLRD